MRNILTFVLAIFMSLQPWSPNLPSASNPSTTGTGTSEQIVPSSSSAAKTPKPIATSTPSAAPTTKSAPAAAGSLASGSFTFASLGDSQDGPADLLNVTNQIASLNPSFVIFNGDLEDDQGSTTTELNAKVASFKTSGLFNETFLIRGNHDDELSGSANVWENFFSTSPNIRVNPAGVTDYVSLDTGSTYLNYSFEYGNSIIIGLDVPGDADLLTSAELSFLDARLTYAESIGLVHAFLFWHGPDYCVESNHCSCTAKADGSCTPSALVTILNKHPIVSATFHGHEHILGWVHVDSSRVPTLKYSYEEFLTSPSGGYLSYAADIYPNRIDYYYPMGTGANDMGFGALTVNGTSFTFNLYKLGTTAPVWSKTFTKSGTVSTPTPTAVVTANPTATPTVTRTSAPTATPTVTRTSAPTTVGTATQTSVPTASRTATQTSLPTPRGTPGPANVHIFLPMILKNVPMAAATQIPTKVATRTPRRTATKTSPPVATNTPKATGTKTLTPGATNTPVAGARPLKYYMADRVINNGDFAQLAGWGINTAMVDFDVNGSATDWQAVFTEAAKYNINIVIWPSDWNNPRPNCNWEAPFPVSANGDITKVKPLLDVASQYPNFIGIINGHESFWTCTNMTFDEMAGLKTQLKAYALSKGREIKVWNYINSLYDASMLPDNQIARIMDVAITWKHCAGNVEGSCDIGSDSALAQILSDRARLANAGLNGTVELVFLIQTFTTTGGYETKFTLPELENYSCEFLNTSALDGFSYYTWDAGWWPDLRDWTDLQPAVPFVHNNCVHSTP